MTKMAKLDDFESMNENFDELKELINDIKSNMMNSKDCNNQFYTIIQTLDKIIANSGDIPEGNKEYSGDSGVLQTIVSNVQKELSMMNKNIDETINVELRELIKKLTEKVNRLEILTNNAGIDQHVVMTSNNQLEGVISSKIKNAYDTIYSQGVSSTDVLRNDIAGIDNNLKECVEYLGNSLKAVSEEIVQHISDDLTFFGTTFEKNTDNLKRSIIDIFSRIQDDISKNPAHHTSDVDNSGSYDENMEMLKNGIYNLNANTEHRMERLSKLIEGLDIFKKLEAFSRLNGLPAVAELKDSLEDNINRIIDKYSNVLQSRQNKDTMDDAMQQFRKDIYNEIVYMLGNVSEYLINVKRMQDENVADTGNIEQIQLDGFSRKIEELASVTELNNSGYSNIQIELRDISQKCKSILEALADNSLLNLKNDVTEIQTKSEAAIKDILSDIKKNILAIQSGGEESDYTYSMQDIESDIAKVRIYLNDITTNGLSINSEGFNDELNSIIVMVDSLKQQMNKMSESDIPGTLDKMKEDLTSISTRVNKLLLTSDSSYDLIEKTLKEFKTISAEIDEQLKSMSDTNKLKNIEENLSGIRTSLTESSNYNTTINQSLVMLAEWVDNAGETLINISEKQKGLESLNDLTKSADEIKSLISSTSDNIVTSVKEIAEDTNSLIKNINISDCQKSIKDLEDIMIAQKEQLRNQEERMNKLDEKLTTIIEFVAKNDLSELSLKFNELDKKMEHLTKSIERLTSYVNEE